MAPPMPSSFSPVVKDFIMRLLAKDPQRRMGVDDVKTHTFFQACHFIITGLCHFHPGMSFHHHWSMSLSSKHVNSSPLGDVTFIQAHHFINTGPCHFHPGMSFHHHLSMSLSSRHVTSSPLSHVTFPNISPIKFFPAMLLHNQCSIFYVTLFKACQFRYQIHPSSVSRSTGLLM